MPIDGLTPVEDDEPQGLIGLTPIAPLEGLTPVAQDGVTPPAGLTPVDAEPLLGATAVQPEQTPAQSSEQEAPVFRGAGPASINQQYQAQKTPERRAKETQMEQELNAIAERVAEYDSQFNFVERLGIRAGKGYTRRAANALLADITAGREELRRLREGDEETQRRAGSMMSPTGIPEADPSAAVAERIAILERDIAAMENEYMSVSSAVHNPHVGSGESMRPVPEHPAMQAAAAANAAGDQEMVDRILVKFFPEMAAETAIPSITQAGPAQLLLPAGTAAGIKALGGTTALARGGFAVGTGLVSGHVESQASFAEFLADEGVDLTKIEQVTAALEDPEIVKKGRQFAAKRAGSVAMWDMLGGYLASKNLVPPGIKNKFARQIMNAGAQIVQQPLTGATGELQAQLVTTGEPDWLEVKLEALGELPSAVGEPVLFHIAEKIGKQPSELDTVGKVLDAFVKNAEITEGEALAALKEIAANGITDEEAYAMLNSIPGLSLNAQAILEDNVPNVANSTFNTRPMGKAALENTVFETTSGNILSGYDVTEAPENTGTVYWSTDQIFSVDDPGANMSTGVNAIAIQQDLVNATQEKLNVLVAQQAPMTVINDTMNRLETQQERLQQIKWEVQQMAELRPQLHKLVQEMVDTFLPGQDVIVTEDYLARDYSSDRNPLGAASGYKGKNGKRTQIIYVNTRRLLDLDSRPKGGMTKRGKKGRGQGAMLSTLSHEFGHAIMQTFVNTLPVEVRQALQAEHRNWLVRQLADENRTIGEILLSKKNPWAFQVAYADSDINAGTLKDLSAPEYVLSFDEFVADMIGRQTIEKSSVVAPMAQRIIPRLQKLLRRFFDLYKDNVAPGETFDMFLRYLKASAQAKALDNARSAFTAVEKDQPSGPQGEQVMRMLESKDLDIDQEVRDEVFGSMDRYNKLMRYGLSLLQLAKENKHIKGLQDYVKAVHEHWATKSNWNDSAMQTMNAWRRLGKKAGDMLGKMVLEITVESDRLNRKLTRPEIEKLMKEKGIDFGGKAQQAWEVYQRIEGDLANALEELYLIENKRINQDYAEIDSTRQIKLMELDELFAKLRNRNYFPLSRFGEWGITMKAKEAVQIEGRKYAAGEVIHMELFENKRQRNKASGQLRRKYGKKVQEVFFRVDEDLKPYTGLPMAVMRQLKQNPKLLLTEAQKQQLQDMIDTMSPTNSIAKRMLERKGTAGYSLDAQRGYANYMLQMGGHIAKMKHIGEMDAAIDSVKKSARYLGQRGIINDKRHEIAAHLERHQDYLLNPTNEWGALRALAFHWFLGYNVKSAIVNLTQVPLVTYPYLAARRELTGKLPGKSDAIAIKEITVAMKDVSALYKDKANRYSADESDMMAQLTMEGIIDESLATELANQAHNDFIFQAMPAETAFTENVKYRSQQFLRGSTWMFQAAEKLNRRVTALAAYRLARKNGMDFQSAVSEAREALRATQFEYARWNRAAFMRGKAGVFFVFMQYLQNVLYFVTRDPGKTRYLMMMFMAAGLQGLPGAEDLLDLFDFGGRQWRKWARTDDPRVDTREWLREQIMTLDASPELIMHGLSAQSFGLGLPAVSDMLGTSIPSLTFESSISAGRVIPGWEALMRPTAMSGQAAVEGAKDVLGAAITVPLNMMRFLGDNDPSDLRAFERMAPSSLRGPARALRILKEGGLYDRGGKLIADFDMSNPEHIAELIGMSLGAAPERVVRAQEARWAEREATEFYAQMRSNLLRDYFYAMEERRLVSDTDAVKTAVAAIDNFNKRVPKGQQLINYGSAYGAWKKAQAFDERGVGRRILDVPLLRDIQSTFPKATEERIK